MIKTNAPIMQTLYRADEVYVDEERRTFLAQKGKILYAKYCGTKGHGICSESFAEYHIWRGEYVVAQDFLIYLDSQLISLRAQVCVNSQAAFQLTITQQLVDRIKSLLGEYA
ncbi:MAG: hypothetical protein H0X30_02640 [Anaerolineae bacterium]|nr:hypothetical protein [Anaerolineae bacterium]